MPHYTVSGGTGIPERELIIAGPIQAFRPKSPSEA